MNDSPSVSLRILSLEDSDTDEELILRELKRGGVNFVSRRVQTRDEFLRETLEFQPDLILADYKLPTFDGGEALALAKERCPEVPVLIISGAVGEETAVELLKAGATDFVLKDRLTRLVPAVRRALREVADRQARHTAEENLRTLNEVNCVSSCIAAGTLCSASLFPTSRLVSDGKFSQQNCSTSSFT